MELEDRARRRSFLPPPTSRVLARPLRRLIFFLVPFGSDRLYYVGAISMRHEYFHALETTANCCREAFSLAMRPTYSLFASRGTLFPKDDWIPTFLALFLRSCSIPAWAGGGASGTRR